MAMTRVAMRYINSLLLPYKHGDDLRKYLTEPPEMPEGAPQHVSTFLSRIAAHDEPDAVIVTQRLEHTVGDRSSPLILDVDAVFHGEIAPSAENLVAVLARLRSLKNRIYARGDFTPKLLPQIQAADATLRVVADEPPPCSRLALSRSEGDPQVSCSATRCKGSACSQVGFRDYRSAA